MKYPRSRVAGRGDLGVVLAVDRGTGDGRILVVTFETCPNSTYRLSPEEIITVRK